MLPAQPKPEALFPGEGKIVSGNGVRQAQMSTRLWKRILREDEIDGIPGMRHPNRIFT